MSFERTFRWFRIVLLWDANDIAVCLWAAWRKPHLPLIYYWCHRGERIA
jgi:hypothetical protein